MQAVGHRKNKKIYWLLMVVVVVLVSGEYETVVLE